MTGGGGSLYIAVLCEIYRAVFCPAGQGNHSFMLRVQYLISWREQSMAFFNSAITVLQTLAVALGAGLGIWGAINLLEGYGNDNPGANAHVR